MAPPLANTRVGNKATSILPRAPLDSPGREEPADTAFVVPPEGYILFCLVTVPVENKLKFQ